MLNVERKFKNALRNHTVLDLEVKMILDIRRMYLCKRIVCWMHYMRGEGEVGNVDVEQSSMTRLDSCHADPGRFTLLHSSRRSQNVAELSVLVTLSYSGWCQRNTWSSLHCHPFFVSGSFPIRKKKLACMRKST